jgi:hypothetical protein
MAGHDDYYDAFVPVCFSGKLAPFSCPLVLKKLSLHVGVACFLWFNSLIFLSAGFFVFWV